MLRFLRAWAWVRWRVRVNAIERGDRADRIQRLTRATEVIGPIIVAAMMLPATAPVVALFARTSSTARTAAFVAGYLLVWVVYGLAAYALYRLLAAADPSFLAWDEAGRYIAGGAVVAAGLYQLTPLKAV